MADPLGGNAGMNPLGGAPAAPRAAVASPDTASVNDGLKAMAAASERQNKLMEDLLSHFDRVQRSIKDTNKELGYQHSELQTVLKDTANIEFSAKRIQQLQKARIGAGSTQSGALQYIRTMKEETRMLLQALNAGKGQGRYVKDVQKSLEAYDRVLKKVESQNDKTWDSDQIKDINEELKAATKGADDLQKSISRIQVTKATEGFRQLGRAIDDAFDNRLLSAMHRTPGLGGFMKIMDAKRRIDTARADITTMQSNRGIARQATLRANAGLVHERYGSKGVKILRQLGYAGDAPAGGDRKATSRRTQAFTAATRVPGTSAVRSAAGALDQLTVKTLVVQNMLNPKAARALARESRRSGGVQGGPGGGVLGGLGSSEEAITEQSGAPGLPSRKSILNGARRALRGVKGTGNPTVADVEGIMQGPGGLLGKTMGKVLKGGGLGESALSASSGLARGALGVASKAAVPIAIATALIQLSDKVAMENKATHEALAGAGLYSGSKGDVSGAFKNTRNTLLSTGFSTAMSLGIGQEENRNMMKSIADGGYAIGGTLNRQQGTAGSVNLGDALNDQGMLRGGGGFYGAMMKNSNLLGRNVGMGQDASVRLTLKLMEKFGQTTEATKEFFVGLDDMMASSGITASKYVEVIDSITDHYTDMNKSLTATNMLLTTVGKTGRLTADRLKEAADTVAKPNDMTHAQRAYAAQNMIATGGDERVAQGLETLSKKDITQFNESMKKFGAPALRADLSNKTEIEEQIRKAVKDNTGKNLTEQDRMFSLNALNDVVNRVGNQNAKAAAFRSKDPARVAGVIGATGEDQQSALEIRRSNLLSLARLGGITSTHDQNLLLANDPKMRARLLSNPLAMDLGAKMGVFSAGEDPLKAFDKTGKVISAGAEQAVRFGESSGEFLNADGSLKAGASPQDAKKREAMIALERARPGGAQGKDDAVAASFAKQAQENPAKLMNQLKGMTETWTQTTQVGSALQEACQALIDQMEIAAKEDEARESIDKTRQTSDVFAKSFEYLFDKLVNLLTPIRNIMTFKWGSSANDAAATKSAEEWRGGRQEGLVKLLEGLDAKGMDENSRKKRDDYLRYLKGNGILSGTNENAQSKEREILGWVRPYDKGGMAERFYWGGVGGRESGATGRIQEAMGSANVTSKSFASYSSLADLLATKVTGRNGVTATPYTPASVGEQLAGMVGGDGVSKDQKAAEFQGVLNTVQWRELNRKTSDTGRVTQLSAAEGSEAATALDAAAKKISDILTDRRVVGGNVTYNVYDTNTKGSAPTREGKNPTTPAKRNPVKV